MAVGRGKSQLHNFGTQQTQGPVVVSIGRLGASDGAHHGGLLGIQFGLGSRAGALGQCALQAGFGVSLLDFSHRGKRDIQGLAGVLGGVAFGEFAQDACARDHAGAVHSLVDEPEEVIVLVFAQFEDAGGSVRGNFFLQMAVEHTAVSGGDFFLMKIYPNAHKSR